MNEQDVLNAILLAEQTVPTLITLINQFRTERSLPPLSAQEQHDKNAAALDQIEKLAQ